MTRSSDYIQLYRGTPETLGESLEYIQKTSTWIIEGIRSQVQTIDAQKEDIAA